MSTRLTTGLLFCLMMSFLVGCATSPDGLIRGQSPTAYPMPAGATSGHGFGAYSQDVPFPFNSVVAQALQNNVHSRANAYYGNGGSPYYGSANSPVSAAYGGSLFGNDSCHHCNGRGCPHCNGTGHRGGQQWAPTHIYQHMYHIPQGMVYPQNPTPAAMTVYPYYTHKGPDDFFYPPLKK